MKNKLPLLVSVTVLALAIFIKVADFSIVQQLQYKVFDMFQVNKPREYVESPVKIIDIDDESLAKIGQWPWPRNVLAKMVKRLSGAGVSAIALDIVFPEEDRTSPKNILPIWNKQKSLAYILNSVPDHDAIFGQEIANANVATGFVLTTTKNDNQAEIKAGYSFAGDDPNNFLKSFDGYIKNIDIIEQNASGNGALNSTTDKDGILRRMPLVFLGKDKFAPSLSAEALRIAQGASSYIIKSVGASDEKSYGGSAQGITAVKVGAIEIPTDSTGKFWIYYTEYTDKRYISAWKILDDKYDLSHLAGQIVFLGTSAAGLKDIRATPLAATSSGVEVHAQAVEQVIAGEFLNRPDWMHGAEILLMIITGAILIYVMVKTSAIWGAFFTSGALALAGIFSWYAFVEHRMLIDPITPSIAILMIYISESLIRYIASEREKNQVRNAFSHYMSPDLVAQLADNPDKLALGGEDKNLTLLFCDIRSFTTISEQFNATDLTKFINKFLTPMTDVILKHNGTIDKYMGDCIMAFWNAPLDVADHPKQASKAALVMLGELKKFNERQKVEAEEAGRKFIPVNIGIGLNSGDCCVGNMGSDMRFDYSVLGDDVNLASRLEGQSKTYGVSVVIGENTHAQIAEMATIELDIIQVKGKTKPVRIFALLGDESLSGNGKFIKLAEEFAKVLQSYRSQNWQQAKLQINECKRLSHGVKEVDLRGLLSLYEQRVDAFIKSPPSEHWDGVFVATSK